MHTASLPCYRTCDVRRSSAEQGRNGGLHDELLHLQVPQLQASTLAHCQQLPATVACQEDRWRAQLHGRQHAPAPCAVHLPDSNETLCEPKRPARGALEGLRGAQEKGTCRLPSERPAAMKRWLPVSCTTAATKRSLQRRRPLQEAASSDVALSRPPARSLAAATVMSPAQCPHPSKPQCLLTVQGCQHPQLPAHKQIKMPCTSLT